MDMTLVVMAAGLGSRYGGVKQIERLGPDGEILMEYAIYDALRAMRMYATEDKNLEIGYTVNGMLLGSSLTEVPEKLDIHVTVNDPDASDSISKVEVIVNSGKTPIPGTIPLSWPPATCP